VIHLFENIDSVRSNFREEARIQAYHTPKRRAPTWCGSHSGRLLHRYPDEVYWRRSASCR